MSMTEVKAYIDGFRRRGWEQARMISYCCLKPWAKNLTLNDVMTLPWENEKPQETPEERAESLERLRAQIPTIKKLINGND